RVGDAHAGSTSINDLLQVPENVSEAQLVPAILDVTVDTVVIAHERAAEVFAEDDVGVLATSTRPDRKNPDDGCRCGPQPGQPLSTEHSALRPSRLVHVND